MPPLASSPKCVREGPDRLQTLITTGKERRGELPWLQRPWMRAGPCTCLVCLVEDHADLVVVVLHVFDHLREEGEEEGRGGEGGIEGGGGGEEEQ